MLLQRVSEHVLQDYLPYRREEKRHWNVLEEEYALLTWNKSLNLKNNCKKKIQVRKSQHLQKTIYVAYVCGFLCSHMPVPLHPNYDFIFHTTLLHKKLKFTGELKALSLSFSFFLHCVYFSCKQGMPPLIHFLWCITTPTIVSWILKPHSSYKISCNWCSVLLKILEQQNIQRKVQL